MPPVISIIGKSKVGKTTLIKKLTEELKSRGYRVATIKHAPEGVTFDEPGKDSWRHIQAGSDATAISSANQVVVIRPVAHAANLDEIGRLLGEDYDIILTEGFKHDDAPKIEVHRSEVGPPFSTATKLIAIATNEPLETKTRQFSLEDVKGLADLLEKGFIKPQSERVSIYVNDIRIPLTSFVREIVSSTLLGMISSLKGVEEIRTLEVFLKKKPTQQK